MSTYTPNVPVSGQSLGNSRPLINSNFMAIQSTFDENHVDFNDMNAGAHTHVDMLAQSADPNPATGLISHYSKAVSGITQWFMQRENTGVVIQMSSGNPQQGASSSFGQTFLPGAFQLRWGHETFSATSTTVTYTAGSRGLSNFPNNTIAVFVTANGDDTNQSAVTQTFSSTGFLINTSKSNLEVCWLAIGY